MVKFTLCSCTILYESDFYRLYHTSAVAVPNAVAFRNSAR